mmetsp:Transcript_22606/g.47640  ORF Transcript_22606/g.47640 Transcript_22606/m.47640 type:complete len:383 (-) Transcript_22606:391-1539(-)
MPPLRSRQPKSDSAGTNPLIIHRDSYYYDKTSKGNAESFCRRNKAQVIIIIAIVLCSIFLAIKTNLINHSDVTSNQENNVNEGVNVNQLKLQLAPMGSIVYGAKGKGKDTAKFVKEAIQSGFRHIATGGFHNEYDEAGVGEGWKESGVPRNELYLQTLFLAKTVNGYGTQNCNLGDGSCPPSNDLSIEDQVHLSIKSSLHNLQTEYIDAVLIHNFRATLQPYDETILAWKALEDYVNRGVIRHLGIVSVHDKEYLTKLHDDAKIKPTIIQNRFHANRGYDISLRPMFKEMGMANQLFWILTGSAGGRVRKNDDVKAIADSKGVTPQILLYSFTMELGGTPLIGSKNINHMKEDVDALVTQGLKWEKKDLVTMANIINKKLIE